ncbi:MAG: PilN domain-containing protein [Pseudomonas sp.]
MLPTYERDLIFAVKPVHSGSEERDVVLWTDEQRLNALFDAFAERGMFLTAAMPRALAVPSLATGAWQLEDEDATTLTCLRCQNGALTHWLQVEKIDLEDEHFRQQWQEATHPETSDATVLRMHSARSYIDLAGPLTADPDYALLPAGAQAARKKMEKGQRLKVAAAAGAVVILLAAMPLLWQSIQARAMIAMLENAREDAAAAREDQAVVRQFEQSWGVLNEFPRQDVAATLLELQSVINPSVLTSLELEEGSVQIEGESSDPQSLLQQLEQNPMFTGVDFARATNNNRYYIELRLTTVDFDGYLQRYFPNARR